MGGWEDLALKNKGWYDEWGVWHDPDPPDLGWTTAHESGVAEKARKADEERRRAELLKKRPPL